MFASILQHDVVHQLQRLQVRIRILQFSGKEDVRKEPEEVPHRVQA